MASSTAYSVVLGDMGPSMPIQLIAGGVPFVINTLTDVITLNYDVPCSGGVVLSKVLTVTDAATGQCAAVWAAGDLPNVGTYRGLVRVTRSGDPTFPRTFPNDGNKILWYIYQTIPQGEAGQPEEQAAWYGFQPQVSDPVPANVPDYLWMDQFGNLNVVFQGSSVQVPKIITVSYTSVVGGEQDFMVGYGVTLAAPARTVVPASAGGASGLDGLQNSGAAQVIDLPTGSRTTTQFRVVLGAALSAGDVMNFIIVP